MNFDVIIIGAGASGLSCAISALRNGKSVAILEHNGMSLKKVAISGGGKCNFTNINTDYSHYLSENPHFVISALKQFTPQNFIDLLHSYKIKFYEKAQGQLFLSSSSQAIMDMLMKEAKKANFFYKTEIKNISKENNFFTIATTNQVLQSKSLVVATGGMSYPNIGASDLGYKIAKQFGLKIIPYRPALVPFNLDNELLKDVYKLRGISVNAQISCNNFSIKESILFTHFGLSGPGILQISSYWHKDEEIIINLLPDVDLYQKLLSLKNSSQKKKLKKIIGEYFPERLVEFLVNDNDVFIAEASNKTLQKIADKVNNWKVIPTSTRGFDVAEVTSGGVDTNEISSQTMEAKKVSGLFFVGEVLDVTGQLGGYNLQWAWSSGFAAGKNV